MPVSAMNPAACATASGRSPSSVGEPVRISRPEPGHPALQERDRFGAGQHVDLDRRGDLGPGPLPGGDQHVPGAAGQPRP